MTGKQRIQAAINFQPVDRVPSFVLDGSSWVIGEDNINYETQWSLEDAGAASIVKRFEEMNCDLVTIGSSAWMAWASAFGSPIDISKVGATIGTGKAIDDVDDLADWIPDMTDDEIREKLLSCRAVQVMKKQIIEGKKLIGDEKMLISFITGPFTAAATLLGTEDFAVELISENEDIDRLLAFTARVMAILADIYVDAGIDIIATAEPVSSGDLISPAVYSQYVVPTYKDFKSRLKTNPILLMHICGNAGMRIDDVKELGVSVFSVDSMVDMEEMLRKADHKLCMMGSLSPAGQMLQGTPESVYAESTRLLELAEKNGGGLLLSSGCDTPSGSPLANILAMSQAAIDFAKK